MRSIRIIAIALMLSLPLAATTYVLDEAHSSIGFSVKHLGISTVRGVFRKFTGTFTADEPKEVISALDAVIDVSSIDTRNDARDRHLRSGDFFNADKYPQATFIMRSFSGTKKGGVIQGDLMIRGISKPVILTLVITGTAVDKSGKKRIAGNATTEIKRTDFNIGSQGDLPVSEVVTLTIDIEAVEK